MSAQRAHTNTLSTMHIIWIFCCLKGYVSVVCVVLLTNPKRYNAHSRRQKVKYFSFSTQHIHNIAARLAQCQTETVCAEKFVGITTTTWKKIYTITIKSQQKKNKKTTDNFCIKPQIQITTKKMSWIANIRAEHIQKEKKFNTQTVYYAWWQWSRCFEPVDSLRLRRFFFTHSCYSSMVIMYEK